MEHKTSKVRLADPADEDGIIAMCRRLHQENGLFAYDEAKVRDVVRKYYTKEGTILGVIGEVGKLEASTCLVVSNYYYTKDTHISELWNFVEAPYRRSGNAEALIEFCKGVSDSMSDHAGFKIPLLTGIITNKQMAGKVRLYRRSLGYPAGAFYVYNAPDPWKSEPMEDHTDLRYRIIEAMRMCNENKMERGLARTKLVPLLKEAAEAISAEDKLWGTVKPPPRATEAA